MADKYKLHHGIHKKTITSRDSSVEEYDSIDAAKAAFWRCKRFTDSIGYYVWFAYVICPDGTRVDLHQGIPYY